MDKVRELSTGNLDLNVRVSGKIEVKVSYLPVSGYRNTSSGDLTRGPW